MAALGINCAVTIWSALMTVKNEQLYYTYEGALSWVLQDQHALEYVRSIHDSGKVMTYQLADGDGFQVSGGI